MADKKTPQILENYEIGDLIGKGRFAEVFRAVKRDLGREVALKILLPAWNDNEAVRGQFMEQAKLVARLRHPRIVEALDLGEENGRLFMAMEYLPKGDLHEWLQSFGKKRPSLLQVMLLVEDVAAALDFIHSQNASGGTLVHGDVKPGNILLTEERDSPGRLRAKLSDLGLLTVLQKAASMSGSSAFPQSSPLYISPEQADDKPPTPFSDQYSLGVVTYELLTGQPPFAGGSDVTIYRQHKMTPPQPPSAHVSQLQREIDEVLLKALAKDPSGRYPNCISFARALRQAVEVAEQKRFAALLAQAREALATEGGSDKALPALEEARQIKPDDGEVKNLFEQAQKTALAARNYQEAGGLLDFARTEAQKLRAEAPDYPDPQRLLTQFAPRPPVWWQTLVERWKRALWFAAVFLILTMMGIKIQGRPWVAAAVWTPAFQTAVGDYWTASPTLTPTNTSTLTPTNTFTPTPTSTPTLTPSPRPFGTDSVSEVILLHRLSNLENAGYVRSMAFSPKGDLFAAGSDDGKVRVWRVDDWQIVKQLDIGSKVNSISFSITKDLLAVGSDDNSARVWQIADWKLISILNQHSSAVTTVSFSADGFLATGESNAIHIWTIDRDNLIKIRTLQVDGAVPKVAFSPNSKLLGAISWQIVSGQLRSRVFIYDTSTWEVHDLPLPNIAYPANSIKILDIEFSPTGMLLGIINYYTPGSYPNVFSITKWNVESLFMVSTTDSYGATTIAVSEDLVSCGIDRELKIRSAIDGSGLRSLIGHTDPISSIIFSPDGWWLMSGSRNEIFLWGVPRWDTTGTPTIAPSSTSTSTATLTLTPIPSSTSTATLTLTPIPSSTSTATLTLTPIPSSTSTATLTLTPIPSSTTIIP